MAKKNKTKKFKFFLSGKFDYSILIITLLLLSLGLIILLSASAPTSYSESGNSYKYVIKQSAFAGIGLVAMFIISKIDYRIYKKFKWFIYVITIVLLVLVGFIGSDAGGAKRWINIFGFSFQPSEFAKVAFIIFYAALLTDLKEKNKLRKLVPGLIYPLIFLIPVAYAVFYKQNHFSATLIITSITLIQMFVAGSAIVSEFKWLIPMGITGVGAVAYIINLVLNTDSSSSENFRFSRIRTWLNIDEDPTGSAWQIRQSLYAIGSGGLFGVGLGESKQKYLYLPEPHNDFIFAVLAEELGFVGSMIVIVLFALFIWRGIVIAIKSQDTFGTLIAIGVTAMIGLQALINIAVVTNTIPVTGMPLPFFSYGGSAMIADLMGVGLLLSVSRNSKKKDVE
jgi:cell division protein FtsW